jgi:hypothetical protein
VLLVVSPKPSQTIPDIGPYIKLWWGRSYSNDSSQAFEYFALRPAVKKLLKLARGQLFRGSSPDIASIVGGFEGKVARCRKRPVSEVRRMHDDDY